MNFIKKCFLLSVIIAQSPTILMRASQKTKDDDLAAISFKKVPYVLEKGFALLRKANPAITYTQDFIHDQQGQLV